MDRSARSTPTAPDPDDPWAAFGSLRPIEDRLRAALAAGDAFFGDRQDDAIATPEGRGQRVRARILRAAIESAPPDCGIAINAVCVEGPLWLEGLSLPYLWLVDCDLEASLELRNLQITGALSISGTHLSPRPTVGLPIAPLPDDTTSIELVDCTCDRLELRACRAGWLRLHKVKVAERCEFVDLELLGSGRLDTISACDFDKVELRTTTAKRFGIDSSRCSILDATPIGIEEFELKNVDVVQHATIGGEHLKKVAWRGGQVGDWLHITATEVDRIEMALNVRSNLTCEAARIGELRIEGTSVHSSLAVRSDEIDRLFLDRVTAENLSIAQKGNGGLTLRSAKITKANVDTLRIGHVALDGTMELKRVTVAEEAAFFNWRALRDKPPRGLLHLNRCEADKLTFSPLPDEAHAGPASCWIVDCKAGTIRWRWGAQTKAALRGSSYRNFSSADGATASANVAFLKDNAQEPQAYVALAASYTALGHQDEADDVRYALRERDIENARRAGNKWRVRLLRILDFTIGFGIGLRTFRCLRLILPLIVLGAAVIQLYGPSAGRYDWAWALGASLHRLLPIVNLSPRYVEFFRDLPDQDSLNYVQNAYFCLHSALGWILGSFLVAALAGFTQKRS